MAAPDIACSTIPPIGCVYTPVDIVRWMVASSLAELRTGVASGLPLRILDPACGDGAFLVELLDAMEQNPRGHISLKHSTEDHRPLVRESLFGVDIDADALMTLRQRWSAKRTPGLNALPSGADPLWTNLRLGNALTGRDFAATDEPEHVDGVAGADGIDWPTAFPDVAAQGGFDLVIGNPPYRREKDAKAVFDAIAATPLGKKWRKPRMDLWHYFLHRGLDLLRPDGVLCFIVNAYWTAAVSSRPLIERLQRETTLMRIVLLGNAPVFPGVTGRHMILQLRKGRRDQRCQLIDLSESSAPLELLRGDGPALVRHTAYRYQSSLYEQGRLLLHPERASLPRSRNRRTLGDEFSVRQGIAENPPQVTRRMSLESGGSLRTGDGVFVLTRDEVDRLPLTDSDRGVLRPYVPTARIDRYTIPSEAEHWLLYLTRHTAPELDRLPTLQDHLSRFREYLERRREVRTGAIRWWHLHWPRQECLFTEPRILAVQMGRRPQFVFVERPTYVGFSVNVIQSRPTGRLSLSALTAILNSASAADWFSAHAKHRGIHLDISGTVLREFPLPQTDASAAARLEALTRDRQRECAAGADAKQTAEFDSAIDDLVEQLYRRRTPPASRR